MTLPNLYPLSHILSMASSPPREFAVKVATKLQEAGYTALWAGGCVRDQLLGLEPKDYDVATDAKPGEIRKLFGHSKTLALGANFGVITVVGPKASGNVEVATFRSDSGYSDGRHPDKVTFSTPELDAQRRDFTINGLFFDPLRKQVIDHVGGRADLEAGIVRAIGSPHERISEDKLRMLRALRFAATFGFEIDAPTMAAIEEHAGEIIIVSAERIAGELQQMLECRNRRLAVELLFQTRLIESVLPECKSLAAQSSDYSATLRVLDDLPQSNFCLALAALFHKVISEPEVVERLGRRLRFSNNVIQTTTWILATRDLLRQADQLPWSVIQPVLVDERIELGLALTETVLNANSERLQPVRFCREQLSLPAEELNPNPLITGNDLKGLVGPPGPNFSKILQEVRAAQLDGKINSREQALDLACKIDADQGNL